MPSAMIHIKTAYKFNKDADDLFFIGNLAPDFADIKEFKDRTHFRSSPDRIGDLIRLKQNTPQDNPYLFGILCHLFLDYKWDTMIRKDFKDEFLRGDEFLFRPYRKQIHLASKKIFDSFEPTEDLFARMMKIPHESYDIHPEFDSKGVWQYVTDVYNNHKNAVLDTPCIFSDEFIEEFTTKSSKEFDDFIKYGTIN